MATERSPNKNHKESKKIKAKKIKHFQVQVTIQMKVTEQYFPVVLFITLHKVVLHVTSEFGDLVDVTIQIK